MRCSSPNCECNMCSACGEQHYACKCDLIAETKEFLEEDNYEYEDRAHRGEYLLRKWYAAKT